MSIFNALFEGDEMQVNREKERTVMAEKEEQLNLMARGQFLKISSRRRIQINKALNFTEKYKVAMELIRDLTGDELFYSMHMKDIGVMPEDQENIREALKEAIIVDATRRMSIHEYRYKQEKTVLNEFIYQSALIDLEILAIDKESYENLDDYEQAMEEKMLAKQSLIEIYRAVVAKGADENVS